MANRHAIQVKKVENFFRVKYERSWSSLMPVLNRIKTLMPTDTTTQEQEDQAAAYWGEIKEALCTLNYDLVILRVEHFIDWYNQQPLNTFK